MTATLSPFQIASLMGADKGEVAARYLIAGDRIHARRGEWTWDGQIVTVTARPESHTEGGATTTRIFVKDAAGENVFFDVLGKDAPIRMAAA